MIRLRSTSRRFSQMKTKRALHFACFIICIVHFVVLLKPAFFDESESNRLESADHTLCVLVPFRDAHEELLEFIPFMNEFLKRQSIKFHFVVVNHATDGNRFNKGSVFNAGFDIITKKYPDCDYIALHDIDLLPLNDDIPYTYPGDEVFHVAHPDLHPLGMFYDPERYIGGIVLISIKQYNLTNGFGNNFWGWGDEDRNFYNRIRKNNIRRVRPSNLTTTQENTFRNIHSLSRKRDFFRCGGQFAANLVEIDFESGLRDLKYELSSIHTIAIDENPLTIFSVTIPCDYSKTPWCKPSCSNDLH